GKARGKAGKRAGGQGVGGGRGGSIRARTWREKLTRLRFTASVADTYLTASDLRPRHRQSRLGARCRGARAGPRGTGLSPARVGRRSDADRGPRRGRRARRGRRPQRGAARRGGGR